MEYEIHIVDGIEMDDGNPSAEQMFKRMREEFEAALKREMGLPTDNDGDENARPI